ncbi:MAG: hypothetical protein HY548_10135 [Elusimicrobia bacterium]|nr:hypothetical protein [Elusimicrobiota bacterium]
MDELNKMGAKKGELSGKLQVLNHEIRSLEERQIDADVVRNNLLNFNEVFQKLTDNEQKELVQLVVKEILYDKARGVIQLLLRPLPEMEWDVAPTGQVLMTVKCGVGNGD